MINAYDLPALPEGWEPDSVSQQEKNFDVAQRLQRAEGFPDVDEAYFNRQEVEYMQAYKRREQYIQDRRDARAMIEQWDGRKWEEIPETDRRKAMLALEIIRNGQAMTL